LLAQRLGSLRELRDDGAPQLAGRLGIQHGAGEVVLGRVTDVENGVGDLRRHVDEVVGLRLGSSRPTQGNHDCDHDRDDPMHAFTVVQLVAMSTSTESGLLHAFLLDGAGGARRLDWPGVQAWKPADGTLWLSLDYSIEDAKTWLSERSSIEPLVR